jgi:hypothetical protein
MFRIAYSNSLRLILPLIAGACLNYGAIAQNPNVAVDMELPLSAEQTAQATGLLPIFNRIKELVAKPSLEHQLELVSLQQQVLLKVTTASLQVDAAAGQIAAEIGETRELENYLSGRRDSKVNKINLLNLGVGGTLGTASAALGFTVHDNAAAATGVLAGATTVALSLVGLKASRGETHELLVPSNMLSEVFSHPSDVNNVYPPVVAAFMNATAPDDVDGLSRQDRLIRSWVDVGRIPEPDSAAGQEKIDRLTSLPGQKIKQTIGDLDDRQAMLYDLQVRLNYMKQDLAILLSAVPSLQNDQLLQH